MKLKVITLLLSLVAFMAPRESRAALIWLDTFKYPNGSLTTQSGGLWTRLSGTANPSDMYLVASNLQVTATSGSFVNRQDDLYRLFSTTNNSIYTNSVQTLYASFIVTCSTAISNGAGLPNGAGSYFAAFYRTNWGAGNGGYSGRIQAFTNGSVVPNTWRLGVTGNSLATNAANGGYPVDLAVNTPYQVVCELDPVSLQAATIWINPVNFSQTGSSPAETRYSSADSLGFATSASTTINAFAFRQPGSFGSAAFVISNLAIATTFIEAATNVASTNAVPPIIVYQPIGVTNFVGASFNLSAVANGQGLGGMSYQWFKNNAPISGATANIYSVASAVTGDSGSYRLVATTPYGLSVTSSVALVSISAQPGPPVFVTQPVSQSVYALQDVTFSCSVLSPGNVTYQWFSNNVAIAGANQNTLLLPAIDPSYAANYRVAVTNDTWPTGIVSTNAALTVRVPAAVSIGFLRTLVDPNTYLVTNTPPTIAYSVTGIITTSTNITTGNTSSYYLQDATGGINIFVTGGQTFRPQLGDVVNFVGVLSSFGSGIELYADATASPVFPYTSFTVLSNNIAGLPAPLPIPFTIMTNIANANYNLGARYVQISDVFFGARAGTTTSTTANDTVTVTNSQGQIFRLFFPYLSLDVAGQTLPSYAYNINGILYSQNSTVTNTLLVTRFADIITNNPTPPSIPISFNRISGAVVLSWSNPSFSLQSSTNVAGPYVTIPGATSPYTNLTGTNSAGFFRLKF